MQNRTGLTVHDLSVERGGLPVLSGLSFQVVPGAALAVTGRNGAGKSTLLRAIAGLLPIHAGHIDLRLPHAAEDTTLGEQAHYLGHANGLKAGLTAVANLRFRQSWSGTAGLDPTDALAAAGLARCADIPVGLLSAGQKRRVALAGLQVAPRPLWVLDEPATALDHDAEGLLVAMLRAHLADGGLAVLALHAPLALSVATLRLGSA